MGIVSPTTLKTYFERGDQPTEAQFVDLIDSFLNKQSAGTAGATDSIASLLNINTVELQDNDEVLVIGFYSSGSGGGGVFSWDDDQDQANHNGVTIIDPNHSTTPGSAGWWTSENTGSGCFIRQDKGYITVKEAGAKGDGLNDDTDAVEAAFEVSDHIVYPSSSSDYVHSQPIVPSNKTIILQEGANITVTDGNRGFQIGDGSSNISIIGTGNNTITGVQGGGGYVSEHLINITGSENVFVSGLILKDTDGDGIFIGGNSSDNACKNVMVDRCIIDNAGRNGISVTSVDFCVISRCEVKNVNSYTPKYGIDVEPNSGTECKRVIIDSCVFHNNDVGGGFSSNVEDSAIINSHFYSNSDNGLVLQGLDSGREQESCTIKNCHSYDNGAIGIWVIRSNNAKIIDCVSRNNTSYGLQITTLDYCTVSNCDIQLNDNFGIVISDVNYLNVTGSEIKNNADAGIATTGSNTTISIKDNFVSFNCTDASPTYDSNIHIFSLTDGTIQNNTCREGSATNTPSNGIFIRSGPSNILFEGNDCLNGGSTNGIIDNSTGNVNGGNRNNDGTYSQTAN